MENWENELRKEFSNINNPGGEKARQMIIDLLESPEAKQSWKDFFEQEDKKEQKLFEWFLSKISSAKQEERERIEKSFIDNSPAFLPPDCKRGYALASMVLKATVASLHQNNNEGGKE